MPAKEGSGAGKAVSMPISEIQKMVTPPWVGYSDPLTLRQEFSWLSLLIFSRANPVNARLCRNDSPGESAGVENE
jgi:hypothetical protein